MLTLEGEYVIHLAKTTKLVRLKDNVLGSAGLLLFFFIAISFINKNGFGSITNAICAIFVLLLCSLFIYFCIDILYHSYFPKDKPIRIGGEGIVDDRGILYPWDKIEYAHFRAITKSCYLQIYYKNADNQSLHYEINLKEYDFNERKIADAIEYWSGRDIGDYEDYMIDDYVEHQVRVGRLTETEGVEKNEKLTLYIPYFKKMKKEYMMYMLWLSPVLIFGYVISYLLYGPTPMDEYKVFVFLKKLILFLGEFSLWGCCCYIVCINKIKSLKLHPDFKNLSDEELEKCLSMVGMDIDYSKQKRDGKLGYMILWTLTTVWVLMIFYLSFIKFGILL